MIFRIAKNILKRTIYILFTFILHLTRIIKVTLIRINPIALKIMHIDKIIWIFLIVVIIICSSTLKLFINILIAYHFFILGKDIAETNAT